MIAVLILLSGWHMVHDLESYTCSGITSRWCRVGKRLRKVTDVTKR